jgi:hypothetical protein
VTVLYTFRGIIYWRRFDIIEKVELALHALTGLAVLGGIYRALTAATSELSSLLMSQYLLWAILFEVIALNLKK